MALEVKELMVVPQSYFTDDEKAQARQNIGALGDSSIQGLATKTELNAEENGRKANDQYLSASINTKIDDAPSDDITYGRKNGAWVESQATVQVKPNLHYDSDGKLNLASTILLGGGTQGEGSIVIADMTNPESLNTCITKEEMWMYNETNDTKYKLASDSIIFLKDGGQTIGLDGTSGIISSYDLKVGKSDGGTITIDYDGSSLYKTTITPTGLIVYDDDGTTQSVSLNGSDIVLNYNGNSYSIKDGKTALNTCLTSVTTDGSTITGNGTPTNPLVAVGGGGSSDHKVCVNSEDTSADYLYNKVVEGGNVELTVTDEHKLKIKAISDIKEYSTPRLDLLTKSASLKSSQSDKYSITGHMFQINAEYQFSTNDYFQFLVTNAPSGAEINGRIAIFMCDVDNSTLNLIAFSKKFTATDFGSKGFKTLELDAIVQDGVWNGHMVTGKLYYACYMLNTTANECGVAGVECASFSLMNVSTPIAISKNDVGLVDEGADDFISKYSSISISILAEGTFKPYIRFYNGGI